MEYVVLRDERTGEILKIGRFGDDFLQEKFHNGKWISDEVLDRQLFDGWLEKISETEVKKIIALKTEHEKIAA